MPFKDWFESMPKIGPTSYVWLFLLVLNSPQTNQTRDKETLEYGTLLSNQPTGWKMAEKTTQRTVFHINGSRLVDTSVVNKFLPLLVLQYICESQESDERLEIYFLTF